MRFSSALSSIRTAGREKYHVFGLRRKSTFRAGMPRPRRLAVFQGVSPPALDTGKDFNSINGVRHKRMTRLTPSPSLCSYGPVEMGAAPA
jgi:hypothetical protein